MLANDAEISFRTSVIGNDIESLDSKINLIGLIHPEIKPIADIFIRRKENLEDADVLRMTKETCRYYQLLQEESVRLAEIIETTAEKFMNLPVLEF
jgi:hypothetical protein